MARFYLDHDDAYWDDLQPLAGTASVAAYYNDVAKGREGKRRVTGFFPKTIERDQQPEVKKKKKKK